MGDDDHTAAASATGPPTTPRRGRGNKCLVSVLALATFCCYAIVLTLAPSRIQTLMLDGIDLLPEEIQPRAEQVGRSTMGGHGALPDERYNTSQNAYAFLMAGCDPSNPSQYRGYIFNILAATYVLKDSGSSQDVVVMVRMAANLTVSTLPAEEESWLKAAGATIRYLPTVGDRRADSFYTATLDKFQVLDLVEYERVLFLDSDVLPICNLDYLFDLMPSEGNNATMMRNNLVIAWRTEPSNAGFMMLKPGEGELAQLKEIIRKQAATEFAKTKWPPFDEIEGWGHTVEWKNILGGRGTKWDFYCAFSDQGLLYYWTKYHKRDVSIVINGEVEHWSSDANREPELAGTSKTGELIDPHSCSYPGGTFLKRGVWSHSPYRDFNHFTGKTKPWLPKMAHMVPKDTLKQRSDAKNAIELWFYALRRQLEKLGLEKIVNVDHISKNMTDPPLGTFPAFILKRYADALLNASETHLFETGDQFNTSCARTQGFPC
ncbi:hypothetical protein ACHAXT_012978 [Thalassiosira profunda]